MVLILLIILMTLFGIYLTYFLRNNEFENYSVLQLIVMDLLMFALLYGLLHVS